ncbi:MAG TPA: malto-oligosyltrehalose trehalohydrolase, partial [Vicinamibacterales bacterium]
GEGTHVRVWSTAERVELVLESGESRLLEPQPDGTHAGSWTDLPAGTTYWYRLDGRGPFPDPASRYQPHGVFGMSSIVDPRGFTWHDDEWRGIELGQAVIYELHVGAFTPDGTFAAATARLPELARLGVTAVELMPLADFAGDRNWGYDGVSLFAPARCYGTPDDLRAFVDTAHRLGLAVLVDVVYNHFGPAGAFHREFSPHYYSEASSPWGQAINLAGEGSGHVRAFFIENALMWLHEYHMDGLRLDAIHALHDEPGEPFVDALVRAVRERGPARSVLVTAEDDRNLRRLLLPAAEGGAGLDAVWADDFHHQVRRALAGDRDGYYADFTGSMEDLATTIRHGWFYRGQPSAYRNAPRGSDTEGVPRARFIYCVQNHDQIGNRAYGDRLHHTIDLPSWRAASTLLLCAPATPLLFMGQEWAASSPFLYFTDHEPELGVLVTRGRRAEFSRFEAFRDPVAAATIPDPQAESTFERSRLDWTERGREPHASVLRLYEALLALRKMLQPLGSAPDTIDARALDGDTIGVVRRGASMTMVAVERMRGAGTVVVPLEGSRRWRVQLTTEEPAYAPDPQAIGMDLQEATATIAFSRPGAVVLIGSS